LIDWLGDPCFHDSEVISLELVRDGSSHIRVHAWKTTDQIGSNGCYVLDRHAIVDFAFEEVTDLQLVEFAQNVISSLQIERKAEDLYRLTLGPCYGVSGFIEGKGLSASVTPKSAG